MVRANVPDVNLPEDALQEARLHLWKIEWQYPGQTASRWHLGFPKVKLS
jgi:hypothetical protein